MKIEYRKGDLFQTEIQTIVHGCNAQGVMNSGIAKIIREKYPKAYERYVNEHKANGLKLGKLVVVPCGDKVKDFDNYKIIVNAITQEFFGRENDRYVSYDAVDDNRTVFGIGSNLYMNGHNSKLTLDDVVFDSGNTITNFTTKENGRLTFGSIDQTKNARIKVGSPYKLIFTPKTTLTNTAGLFYFVLSDAVDASGNKIDLIVE